MKKIILLAFVLASCGAPQVEEMEVLAVDTTVALAESSAPIDTVVVTSSSDSMMEKANTLILSTKNAEKKVSEIRVLKAENVSLKKELTSTKSELLEMKAALADTTKETHKKSGFIKRVLDSMKRDTIN